MLALYVPGVAPAGTVNVMTEDPLPVRVGGLNAAVTPAGSPIALNVIGPLKLSCTSTISCSVTLPIFGGAKSCVVVGASVKSALFTIMVADTVCVIAPAPEPL
jgi:hypothetical protein